MSMHDIRISPASSHFGHATKLTHFVIALICMLLLYITHTPPVRAQTGSISCRDLSKYSFRCVMTVSGTDAQIDWVEWMGDYWPTAGGNSNAFSVYPNACYSAIT